MATILQGSQTAIGSNTAVQAAQRVINMAPTIALLEPDSAPLTVFTKRLGSGRETDNPTFSWLEDILAPKVLTVDSTGGYGSTTVGLATGDGSKVASQDLIKNPASGEIFLVSSVSTDTLTVVRAFGVTASATIGAGQTLLIIGNANKENDTVRDIKATQTTKKTNYAQIFRTPFAFSRTLRDSNLYGGNYKPYQSRKKGVEHRIEIERQFLFGEPYEQTNTDSGRWATGGLEYWIQTNRFDANRSVTYASIMDLAQTVFRFGNQKMRLCLAAPALISKIDLLAEARLFHQTSTEMYGVKLNKIQTSHGDLMLVKHPLLQETSAFNERMYVLDMDAIKERPFKNANTTLRQNIQTPSADGELHEYLTQVGLQVDNEQKHAIYYNAA